ncbi:unnamed protein product [Calypogeia fissa]
MANATEFRWHSDMYNWRDVIPDPVTCAWGISPRLLSVLFGRNVNRIKEWSNLFYESGFDPSGHGRVLLLVLLPSILRCPFQRATAKEEKSSHGSLQ